MCLSNKKPGENMKFPNQLMDQIGKTDQYFVEITEYSHSSFLAWPLERVKLWLEMIDSLIIRFRHFDWISAVSRKVLTFIDSELQHFETLRFLWQLSTTSHMKQDPFTHKLVSSALQNNALQDISALDKSSVNPPIIIFWVARTAVWLDGESHHSLVLPENPVNH